MAARVTFTIAGKRTIDIGRDQHLDWTLPDPSRFISGKHCEVRYMDGGYWLHDVSTNGTYLNGAEERMRGPHRLKSGDRFIVGHYVIAAALDADAFEAEPLPQQARLLLTHRRRMGLGERWCGGSAVDPNQLRCALGSRSTGERGISRLGSICSACGTRQSIGIDRFREADVGTIRTR